MNGLWTGRTPAKVFCVNWRNSITQNVVAGLIVGTFLALGAGCQPESGQRLEQGRSLTEDGVSATDIFSRMIHKYRNADQYSDKGVLYMSYRLEGRPIQEPQPWAIAVGDQGEFSADLFNAQIRCDGRLLSCYVYDIESGNLDNQRLLLPVTDELPINKLFADKIASHFIAGFSEMPLDATQPKEQTQLMSADDWTVNRANGTQLASSGNATGTI